MYPKSEPWFDYAILDARHIKRFSERKWAKTGLVVHLEAFKTSSKYYYDTTRKIKTHYFHKKICSANSRQMFKIVNDLTTVTKPILPVHDSKQELASELSNYFNDNISSIKSRKN